MSFQFIIDTEYLLNFVLRVDEKFELMYLILLKISIYPDLFHEIIHVN